LDEGENNITTIIMAKQYDETNTFKLFVQDVEEGSKKPNLTGEINIDGKVMRLAGWTKVSEKGTKWVSGQLSEKQEKNAEPAKVEAPF